CDVTTPCPRGPVRLTRPFEFDSPLGLDPEAGVRAVGLPCIVLCHAICAQPAALEQRADDVTPVADHMHGGRARVCTEGAGEHVARLGVLLHAAQTASESERPDALEDPAHGSSLLLLGKIEERWHGRLQQRNLAKIDPARL